MITQIGKDGLEHVIVYICRFFRGSELNWSVTDKECFAMIYICRKNRVYLYGKEFEVITDHWALVFLTKSRELTARHARWVLFLQEFRYRITYKKGKYHFNADAMSRPVLSMIVNTRPSDSTWKAEDPYDNKLLIDFLKSGVHNKDTSKTKVNRIESMSKHYNIKDDYLYYRRTSSIQSGAKYLTLQSADKSSKMSM